MNSSSSIGFAGEEYATQFLKAKGYTILERNFRCRTGEIDIIAADSEFIVFAEVKTRKNAYYASALEYVGYQKQKKVISASKYWLMLHPSALQPRFDVIEIYYGYSGRPELTHLEGAFE